MNDKLTPFRDAIFYRYRQRYTSEMIQLWLHETHKLSVHTSSIDRSIYKSMKSVSHFEKIEPDSEYSHYRTLVTARRQKRNYKKHLNKVKGVIENYKNKNYTASKIHTLLINQGITTSLSSVHRALRLINEENPIPNRDHEKRQDQKIVCET